MLLDILSIVADITSILFLTAVMINNAIALVARYFGLSGS
jgi:hypothetical protein